MSETGVGWPKSICEFCIRCLTEWNELYIKCKEVDAMFGKLLNRSEVIVNNDKQSSGRKNVEQELSPNLKVSSSHNDHNYCPGNNSEKTSFNKTSDDISIQASLTSSDEKDRNLSIEIVNRNMIDESSKDTTHFSSCVDNKENVDSSQIQRTKSGPSLANNMLSCSSKTSEKSNLGKQQYKIGITLVKNKDCNEGAELDFNSLKSILISKVNQLFQSLCNDEALGKSLINGNDAEVNDGAEDISETEDEDIADSNNQADDKSDRIKFEKEDEEPVGKDIRRIRHATNESYVNRIPRKRKGVGLDETGSYLCSDCGSMITERKSFLTHRRMYHVEKKCHYCDEILPSLHEYRRHLRLSHLDKISNSCCEICGATFIRRERLQRHRLIIHNIGEYVHCDICNKKCASRQQLYCHKSDAHNKIKNSCHHCGQNFASHQSFLAHLKKKHSYKKNLSCINCDKIFSTRTNLEIHVEKCQNENINEDMKTSPKILSANSKLYTCLICSVKITDEEMLKQHMNYHANDEYIKNLVGQKEASDYECMLCGLYLKTEKDLALHRFYSHQEPPFICRVSSCNVTFWKRMSLIMHQISVHKIPNNTCKLCSITFVDLKEKRRHMKAYHSSGPQEKPYSCSICNRRFCWKYTLKTHMVIHSDVKLHKCHVCGKEFKLKSTLSKHMQYHQRKEVLETEGKPCEMTVAEVADISNVTEQVSTDTETKQMFTVSNIEEGLTVVNTTGLLKICTVFKCPECSILFTHKETRDSHYLEEHAGKETTKYQIEDVINVSINESEFV